MQSLFFKRVIALAALTTLSLAALKHTAYTYVVTIFYDPKDPVTLKGTYKGHPVDLSDGIGFLPETDQINTFHIIITSEHPVMSPEPLPHLERISDTPCLWYDISWSKEGLKTLWKIEKRPDSELPSRIPNDALIICYPPEFIEKIEMSTQQESASTIIHFPAISLKKDLSADEKTRRDKALTRSILAHLDVNACLSPTATQLVKQGNKVKIACGCG